MNLERKKENLLNHKRKFRIASDKCERIVILLDLCMKITHTHMVAGFSFQQPLPWFQAGREILNASALPKFTAIIHSMPPPNTSFPIS